MTKAITSRYASEYVKGLKAYLLSPENNTITLEEIRAINKEIRTWQNTLRVLQTFQYSYYNTKTVKRGESVMPLIIKESRVNRLHAVECRKD